MTPKEIEDVLRGVAMICEYCRDSHAGEYLRHTQCRLVYDLPAMAQAVWEAGEKERVTMLSDASANAHDVLRARDLIDALHAEVEKEKADHRHTLQASAEMENALRARLSESRAEVERLEVWKYSAMTLFARYDDVAESFAGVIGSSKVENLEQGVARLRAAIEQHRCGIAATWCGTHGQYHGDALCAALFAPPVEPAQG